VEGKTLSDSDLARPVHPHRVGPGERHEPPALAQGETRGLGLAGAALLGFVALWQPAYGGPLLLVALPAQGCLVAAVLWARRGCDRRSFAGIFLACWIVGVGVQLFFMSTFDSYRGQAELARVIEKRAPRGVPLHVVELPESQIIYYLRFPLERHDHVGGLLQRIRSLPPGKYHIVTHAGQVTTLKAVGQVETIADCPPRRSHLPKLVYLVLNMRDGSLSQPVLNKSP